VSVRGSKVQEVCTLIGGLAHELAEGLFRPGQPPDRPRSGPALRSLTSWNWPGRAKIKTKLTI
jgi:hypothetical protein